MNKFFTIILILAIAIGATSCNKKKYHEETTTSEKSSSGSTSTKTFTVNGVEFKMIKVEGGTFTMGPTGTLIDDALDCEFPTHKVSLSTFYIGQTEVTQELWTAVMNSNPSYFKGSNLPVEQVTWGDCQKFIAKLNELTGEQFRMLTEAEWEYAARGGNKSKGYKYSGSNIIDEVAWFTDNAGGQTHEVGTKKPNELGIYDMSGNVWTWISDWYGEYVSQDQTNPTGSASGSQRIHRGASWFDPAISCRLSKRAQYNPADYAYTLGLRLAM